MSRLLTWGIRILVLTLFIAGLVYVHLYVTAMRHEVAKQQKTLEEAPEKLLQTTTLKAEIAKYSFDVERIQERVINLDHIGEVVSQIEELGRDSQLTVQVPDIKEGDPATQGGGPIKDVQMRIVAVGDPVNLLRFLHKVEHMPYVLQIDSILMQSRRAGGGGIPAPATPGASTAPGGYLEFNGIISVYK